jgi:RNA polymerase sigma factor (sigma-70 family)
MPLFDSLYNFARWLVHNSSDAEDLVQETYLKALRNFASFQHGTNFRAWIFQILRNTLFKLMFKNRAAHDRCAGIRGGFPRFARNFRQP